MRLGLLSTVRGRASPRLLETLIHLQSLYSAEPLLIIITVCIVEHSSLQIPVDRQRDSIVRYVVVCDIGILVSESNRLVRSLSVLVRIYLVS